MKSTGLTLARNTLYSFITQIALGVLAFICIPTIIHRLGEEAFGILTLIWTIVGYFSILDLGVGQASVKFLAEHLGREEYEEANSTFWVSVSVSIIIGILISLVLVFVIPLFLDGTLNMSEQLRGETRQSFYWVILAVPFVILQGVLRAVPMAIHRFDLYNLLVGFTGLLQWGGSIVVILLGMRLFEVVVLTIVIRILGALIAFWIAMKLVPQISFRHPWKIGRIGPKLLQFGGWLTISQVAGPIMRYIDRILVVSLCSLRSFTFYVVPYEAVSRLLVIPQSLTTTLFPAMVERESRKGESQTVLLYKKALNFTIILVLPITIALAIFSNRILELWLGGEFPLMSGNVFRILAVAIFVQSIGYIPVTTLQAIGRPDVAPKMYLVEIPLYLSLCFLLIPKIGIDGAAWAWLIRIVCSTAWLLWKTHRSLPPDATQPYGEILRRGFLLNGVMFVTLLLVTYYIGGFMAQVILCSLVFIAYACAAWLYCLDSSERRIALGLVFNRSGVSV